MFFSYTQLFTDATIEHKWDNAPLTVVDSMTIPNRAVRYPCHPRNNYLCFKLSVFKKKDSPDNSLEEPGLSL